MFVVHISNNGYDYFLKSTTWSTLDRANIFLTENEARQALEKASQFMKKAMVKKALIVKKDMVKFCSEEQAKYHSIHVN